jgi:YHS domain-containing protein
MFMDRVFDKDQIPVQIDGHTYYNFCDMCAAEMKKTAATRTAVDPVTGKKIDKSSAVIAARPDGSVLYFENAKTLEQYNKGETKKP